MPLLVDSSVLIKWFHSEGESNLAEARALRAAHVGGVIDAHVLDLSIYEVGNVLIRSLRWSAAHVADQLNDLLTIVGPPLAMAQEWLGDAAELAERNRLSFYDASWAAASRALGVPLVSADGQLLRAGLAESVEGVVARLRLRSP